jgi:hypothetical protein
MKLYVDPDPEFDGVVRCASITVGHAALPFGRTTQCIYHTGKILPASHRRSFDDAAPVFDDLRVDNVRPDRP